MDKGTGMKTRFDPVRSFRIPIGQHSLIRHRARELDVSTSVYIVAVLAWSLGLSDTEAQTILESRKVDRRKKTAPG